MDRKSIFDYIKTQYSEYLDPMIIGVNILYDEGVVYLEIVKERDPYTLVAYKYDLKKWPTGKTYTAEELSISDHDDFSNEAKEFAHLSLPLFDVSNRLDVSEAQFIDMFMMDKETLTNLTDLFSDPDAE